MNSYDDDPAVEFIETIGLRFQEQNMPRIAGRLFGLLLLEGGPFSFGELADKLQVSRGSISTNARMLAEMGLIERVSRPGDRQDHYRIVPDGMVRLFKRQLEKLWWSANFYHSIEARLPDHKHQAKQRLHATGVYARKAADGLALGITEAEELLKQSETA